ncbi:hypothetical protein BDR06DRAFT_1009453 [Suillus hirtellus]|nr:hypothetical protein BDR06DRAFT_1009453 [Suillus hirtellus]
MNLDQSPLGYIQENGGSMDRSMCDDEQPDKSADDITGSTMDPYDCSWEESSAAEYIAQGLCIQEKGSSMDRSMCDDEQPDKSTNDIARSPTMDPYDCGLKINLAAKYITLGLFSAEKVDLYDCGWEDHMDIEMPGEGPATGLPMGEEEDAYDCGWEDAMEIQPAASSMTLSNKEDPYDCGWGDQQKDTTVPISSTATEDLYDCGWEDEEDANRVSEVMNLEDPYDCGWGNDDTDNLDVVSRNDPSSKQLGRQMDSLTPMYRLDIIDLTSSSTSHRSESNQRYQPMTIEIPEVIDLMSDTGSSSHTASQLNTFQEAGLSMHRAIQQLNSIGTHQHKSC